MAQLWGIGQTKVVKVLHAGRQLLELENSGAALADVHESILHSQLLTTDIKSKAMSDVRSKMWKGKTAKQTLFPHQC